VGVVVLVDGENVRRSRWPNVARERLERLVDEWAHREGHDARVVWEGPGSADDSIAASAADVRGEGRELWVATSDRDLRQRVAADRTIGGRTFLREIGLEEPGA
jgi:rRNA-processing protein FCF1